MSEPTPIKAPQPKRAKERDLQFIDYAQQKICQRVDNDTTLADILKPAFWMEVIGKLKAPDEKSLGTLITVITRDQNFEADLRVLKIENSLVSVRLRFNGTVYDHPDRMQPAATVAEPEGALPPVPEGYKVGFTPRANGNQGGHYLQLTANQAKLGTFQTRKAAIEAAIAHAKAAGTYVDPAPVPVPESAAA